MDWITRVVSDRVEGKKYRKWKEVRDGDENIDQNPQKEIF